MKMGKSLLLGSAAGFVAVAGAQAADLPVKAKPVEYVKVCTLYGAGYYYVPGTDTCLKLGAYIRFQIENDASGGLPFMNGAGGIYTRTDTNNLNNRIRAVLTWDSRTQTEYGTLRAYFRVGAEATTSVAVADLANATFFDRGFIQFAGFTVGRADSFFDFTSLAPYSYANNGRVSGNMGATGQQLFAYTAQLGNGFSATLSIEDSCFEASGNAGNAGACRGASVLDLNAPIAGGIGNNTVTFANATSTLTVDNGSSSIPDIVGNVRVDQAWGSAQLSGALHMNKGGYYTAFPLGVCAPGNSTTCDFPEDEIGWAVAAGIKINLPMIARGDVFDIMGTFSEGAVGYAVRSSVYRLWTHGDTAGGALRSYGVGYAGDGVFINGSDIEQTRVWSIAGAFQHFWTPQLRSSIYGGYAAFEFNATATAFICPGGPAGTPVPTGTSGLVVANCDPDFSVWQLGSRTQWNPHPYLDIGVDVLWTHLNTAHEGVGVTTAAQGARIAGPVMIEDQDVLTVMGRIQYNFRP
jgi:hypothetical protein